MSTLGMEGESMYPEEAARASKTNRSKALEWRIHSLGGVIHHLSLSLKAIEEERFLDAHKHLQSARYDLGAA